MSEELTALRALVRRLNVVVINDAAASEREVFSASLTLTAGILSLLSDAIPPIQGNK